MTARKPALVLIPLILVVAGVLVYFLVFARGANDGTAVRVFGNIEVTDVEVSFKIPGRVQRRLVDEGQLIAQGQPVAELDAADLKCELALRRAELDAARAVLAELEAGSRPDEIVAAKAARDKAAALLDELRRGSRRQEVEAAKAALDSAVVERDRRKIELDRAEKLVGDQAIAVEIRDARKAAYEVAQEQLRQAAQQYDLVKEGPREEEIRQAEEALRQATAQHALVVEGPRKEVKEQARARVQQAQAAVDLAQTRLGYATLVSPLSGLVLSKHVEPGEYVMPGTPIVTVADMKNVWLRAYLDEPDVGPVKIGQKAWVRIDDAQRSTFEGRVSFIAQDSEFTPKSVQTEKERTRLVYRIKIDVDNSSGALKRGMPADAEIFLRPDSSLRSE